MAFAPSNWDDQTIGVTYYFPDLGSPIDFGSDVVGPGGEGSMLDVFSYDLSANQIVMSYTFGFEGSWTSADFNGPRFYDFLGTAPDLTGVSVNGATTMVGLDAGDLTWSANEVLVNWQGLTIFPGMQVVLDLQFGREQSVPEASTWAAGGALALMAGGMWLRRRA